MPYREPEFLPWDGRRVPLTFVGGYLGAGKTTLINEVLAVSDRPIAVIVNDVGAINIDAKLIRRRHGDTIELTNGCICCSSIEEMGSAFDRIRARPVPPDHVLVELSGVAEPQRMAPWGDTAGFRLDGTIVVVAADQLTPSALPLWIREQLCAQIISADLLIVSKADLVEPDVLAFTLDALVELAPHTPVVVSDRRRLGPGAIGRFLALGGRRAGGTTELATPTLFDAHESRCIPFPAGLCSAELSAWLGALTDHLGALVVRAKGVARTNDLGLALVQVVGRRAEITPLPDPELEEPTDLVVITLRDLHSGL